MVVVAVVTTEALGAVVVVVVAETMGVAVVVAASAVKTVDSAAAAVVATTSGVALIVTTETVRAEGGDHGVTAGAAGRGSPSYGKHRQVSMFDTLLFFFGLFTVGPIQVLRNAFFLEIGPPTHPSIMQITLNLNLRNAFPGKFDTRHPHLHYITLEWPLLGFGISSTTFSFMSFCIYL